MQFKEALGDFSTVEKMKEIYETTEDNNLKFAICKEFMKYEYPQRKAVEFENDNTGAFNIIVADEKHKKMLEDL